MSDRNSRKDDLQDYLDLLEEYSKKDENADLEMKGEAASDAEFENDAEDIFTLDGVSEDFDFYNEESEQSSSEARVINPPEENEKNPFKRLSSWFNNLPKKKKIVVSVIAIFLSFVIVLTSVVGIFLYSKFSKIVSGDELLEEDQIYQDPLYEDIEIDIGSAGFKQALIDWATTGNDKHMYSKNVVNVLLIGADKTSNTGNTDVMMLLSLNKKTKKITIASFLRDSYLYIEGKKSSYCTKLNAAYSMGGPECLMKTIENNYKIEIDNYVMVNFKTFETIIDEMGGVQVPKIEQFESDYNVKKHGISLPVGENVTLNGKEALCFVRNRSCYGAGDLRRTQNQRTVIDSIMNRVKEASVSDLNKYIDILLPQVATGYTEAEIISLGTKAIMGGWAGYERTQLQVPADENCQQGDANMWIWVVDYHKAAHDLQMQLYGQSNINIEEGRTTLIDVYNGVNYNSSSNNNSVGDNNADDRDYSSDDDYDDNVVVETQKQNNSEDSNTENTEPETEAQETVTSQETTVPVTSGDVIDEGEGNDTGDEDSGDGGTDSGNQGSDSEGGLIEDNGGDSGEEIADVLLAEGE